MNATDLPLRMIYTKYHGPSNRCGSRYSATSAGGKRMYLACDDALSHDENARAVADRLCLAMTHEKDAGRFALLGVGSYKDWQVFAYAYSK